MFGKNLPAGHRPYSQTHLLVFTGCTDTAKIVHPGSEEKKQELLHEFVGHVIDSGFEVMGENARPSFSYDVVCGDFGPGYAVTIAGILSGSHVALHGYLEYNNRVEILFNLCYLPGRRDHGPALEKAKQVFRVWLKAKRVRLTNYRKEYMQPKRKG